MIKRGEIYYIEPSKALQTTGSEQRSNRPGIVVSNNENNEHSSIVEIVYLTTQPKNSMPTHVIISSAVKTSIALCEQVNTVAVERLADYMGQCSEDEINKIDEALMISLNIGKNEERDSYEEMLRDTIEDLKKQLQIKDNQLQAKEIEVSIHKSNFKELVNELVKKGG
jgi:mRNA interferase MazF